MAVTVDVDFLSRGIGGLLPELREVDEDLHAHPELSFAGHRTPGIAADRLDGLGYEVTTAGGVNRLRAAGRAAPRGRRARRGRPVPPG